MRRARLAFLLVLFPALAFAGWRQVGSLTGTAQDVVVADAGVVVATSNTGAFAWRAEPDGGVTTLASISGTLVGAGLVDGGCLVALDGTGNLQFSTGCGTTMPSGATTGRRLRVSGELLVMETSAGTFDTVRTGPLGGPWPSIGNSWTAAAVRSLQTARIGGVDFHVANTSSPSFQLSVDGGMGVAIVVPSALRDVSPFARQGLPAALGVTTAGALLLLPDVRSTSSVTPTMPAGLSARFVGMAPGGGLITTVTGEALSPLPDPAQETLVWRARTLAPPQLINQVHCLDARWCAAIDSTLGVHLYENASPPRVFVAPTRVDAGTTVRLVVDGGDPDGDPLFFSWTGAGASISPVAGVDDGQAVDVALPGAAACGAFPLSVTASDGVHTTTFPVDLQIGGRGALQLVTPADQPWAGGPSLAFAAFVDGGCEGATVSWSSSDGQSSAGPSFAWTPPATSCNAAGEVVTLTATATWTSGAPSSESTQVTLEPWGAPLPPVFAPASQDAGTTRVWGPAGAEHVCSASGGFPGTELLWAAIDAGPFSFRLVDGGLELSTPECLSGQFVATARRQVVGEQRGRVSDAGTLVVDVRANLAPLDATTPFVVTAGADAGVLEGTLQATASCADQRGLTSEVTVFDGPTSVASGVFAVPGGWALPVPGGCAGGVRDVVARLLEDGGFTGAEHRAQVSLERTPVAVGPQRLERTTATCGVGVRARVELEPVAGACAAVDTSWRVVAGPDVLVSAGSGAAFELQTVRGDLSATGQSFTIEWTVDGGGTNVLSETRTLAVEAEPFVSLSVASSPALRTEEGATFYEVTLSNGTACEVGELVLELPLTAALPLPETVRVDGAVKPAMLEGAALRVEELSLPASGQTVVRFGARARLLGTPSVSPVVTLHGVPVSVAAAPTGFQAGGCGCSSGGPPFAVLAFAALVLRRRRR